MNFFQALGWVGMVAVAGAFLLNSLGVVISTGVPYQLLNLVGCVFMGLDLWTAEKRRSGPFGLQIFWGVVSVTALARALF